MNSFFLAVAIVVAVLWTNTVTGQTQSTIACEGSTLKFNCPASQTIQVTSAVYGRSDSSICCNDANVCKNTNCKTDVTTIVSGICNLLNICSIPGASGLFGDPCVGTSKYVKVDYNCVSGIDTNYLGCYADERQLGMNYFIADNLQNMTIEYCSSLCKLAYYKYAGLQNGVACFCGDSYGLNGVNSNGCTVPCRGDSSQKCGAIGLNSIYDVSKISGAISAPSKTGLINSWSFSNNLNDDVGGQTLFGGGSKWIYTSDRYCNPNSAVYFNRDYLQAPPGVYFGSDFTFNTWIWTNSFNDMQRIFDFSNLSADKKENVVFSFYATQNRLATYANGLNYLNGMTPQRIQTGNNLLNLSQWYMVSLVLSGTTGYIYLNGVQVATGPFLHPQIVTRQNNYFGKGPYAPLDAILDDMELYNVALSASDINAKYQSALSKGTIQNTCNKSGVDI